MDAAYPKIKTTIGDRLRAWRLDLGLLQKDVAEMIGVSVDTICYWENDRVRPSKEHLQAIDRFLYRQDNLIPTESPLKIVDQ